MEQNLKALAEKELNEELKRGKPKDVKKLYELLCRSRGKEEAFKTIVGLLTESYELMPNGRYKLNVKQYNGKVESLLKQAKTEKPAAPSVKPAVTSDIKKVSVSPTDKDLKQKYEKAIRSYASMDDFATLFEQMMFIDEEMASRLYVANKDLFFTTLDRDISELQKTPVTLQELDSYKDRSYFYLNLIQDIFFSMANSTSRNPSLMDEYEQYVKGIASRPLDWMNEDRHAYELMLSELLESYIKAGEIGKSAELIQEWKRKLPDTNMPEKAVITGHWFSGRPDGHSRALELSNQLLDGNRQLKNDEVFVLEIMEEIYKEAGDEKRLKQVKAWKEKYDDKKRQID